MQSLTDVKRLKTDIYRLQIKARNIETVVKSIDERLQKIEESQLTIANEIKNLKYWSDLQAQKKS